MVSDGTIRKCRTCQVMMILRNGVWVHDYDGHTTRPWWEMLVA